MIREDPFTLEAANYTFGLAPCCRQLPSVFFPHAPAACPSWAVTRLGPARLYNPKTGLQQPGFLPSGTQLHPWTIPAIHRPSLPTAGATMDEEFPALGAAIQPVMVELNLGKLIQSAIGT